MGGWGRFKKKAELVLDKKHGQFWRSVGMNLGALCSGKGVHVWRDLKSQN
jgi:hypothetical protein